MATFEPTLFSTNSMIVVACVSDTTCFETFVNHRRQHPHHHHCHHHLWVDSRVFQDNFFFAIFFGPELLKGVHHEMFQIYRPINKNLPALLVYIIVTMGKSGFGHNF